MKIFRRKFKTHMKIKDSVPTILSFVAVSGVIFTAAAAIHDTPKAVKILKHEEDDRKFKAKVYKTENGDLETEFEPCKELSAMDICKLTWKCYLPTMAVASATIFCILKANSLNKRQKSELIAACGLMTASYAEYRNKVKEGLGEGVDGLIKESIAKEHVENDRVEFGDARPDAKTFIFIDSFMNTVFESTIEDVQAAEYHLNRNFSLRGYTSMGEFYRFLGLDEVYATDGPLLERFGWSYDMGTDMGYQWIDFVHQKIEEEGKETMYLIEYPFEPVLGYMY